MRVQDDVQLGQMNKSDILEFIKKHSLTVIATSSLNNEPEAAVIEFGETNDFEIIFDTFTSSRKYKNLKENPRAAFVIGWDEDVTVQYEGIAEELSGETLERYQEAYFKKNPSAEKWANREGVVFFRVVPRWVRYSDLNKDPWEIHEFTF